MTTYFAIPQSPAPAGIASQRLTVSVGDTVIFDQDFPAEAMKLGPFDLQPTTDGINVVVLRVFKDAAGTALKNKTQTITVKAPLPEPSDVELAQAAPADPPPAAPQASEVAAAPAATAQPASPAVADSVPPTVPLSDPSQAAATAPDVPVTPVTTDQSATAPLPAAA